MRESHLPLGRRQTVVFSKNMGQHFPLAPDLLSTWKMRAIVSKLKRSIEPPGAEIAKATKSKCDGYEVSLGRRLTQMNADSETKHDNDVFTPKHYSGSIRVTNDQNRCKTRRFFRQEGAENAECDRPWWSCFDSAPSATSCSFFFNSGLPGQSSRRP